MSLADRVLDQPSPDEPKYTPRTEFDGRSGFIQTGPLREQPADYTAILTQFGYDPATVAIVGHPRIAKWEQRSQVRDEFGKRTGEFETIWLSSYRFHIAPIETTATHDLEAVLSRARAGRRPGNGPHWLVFQAGDLQIGKRSRDGSTEQIIERYVQSVEAARCEFAELKRHGIEGIQVSLPGDCIEGNQSQRGQNLWLTQETITEQTRILRRLVMHTVEQFAPLTERVFIDVINGNHDQAQRQQNTYPGDGWATEAAIGVSDALKLNPLAFGHIEVRVPEKWSGSMTVPVGDTVVTLAHGHQWRRDKAFDWWAGQAIGNHSPGAAQILQHGHWHEWMVRSNADRTVIGSPTFDCGSDWYRETRGGTSRRGAAVYLLRAGEVSRMTIL